VSTFFARLCSVGTGNQNLLYHLISSLKALLYELQSMIVQGIVLTIEATICYRDNKAIYLIAHDKILVAVDFTACVVHQQLKCSCMKYINTTQFFQLSLLFSNRAIHSLYIHILKEEQSWGNIECIRNALYKRDIYLMEYDFSTYALNEINMGLWGLFKQIVMIALFIS